MQAKLTVAEARRCSRGELDDAETDRIMRELHKDAWAGETAAPRFVVAQLRAEWSDGFESQFLTDDPEAARFAAILLDGTAFAVAPVTA
jgi:hypothetical protein